MNTAAAIPAYVAGTVPSEPLDLPDEGVGLPATVDEIADPQVARTKLMVDGRVGHAVAINGTVPAPLIRLKEGQNVRLTVENRLDEDTSIHWHGFIVPFQMDGVPGISFPGIRPGQSFTYEFPIKQSGTYWYHSHTHLQEQEGVYGSIVQERPDLTGVGCLAHGRRKFVVNLRHLAFIDSVGIGVIVRSYTHLASHGGMLKLVNSINDALPTTLPERTLEKTFTAFWPELEQGWPWQCSCRDRC